MTKIIHYCWFGSPVPDTVKRNVENWSRLNPDFEIREWNDENFSLPDIAYARRALQTSRYAHYSDVARLVILLQYGGWYLDSDVELLRPLSIWNCYCNRLILGYIYDCALGTAVTYSPRDNVYLREILNRYSKIRPGFYPCNNSVYTEYFINEVPGFLLNGERWENDKALVLPRDVFEQPSLIRTRGTSIHHCCGSWAPAADNRFSVSSTAAGAAHLIKWAKRWRRNYLQLRSNEFVPCYRAAKKGIRLPFDASKYYLPGGLGE